MNHLKTFQLFESLSPLYKEISREEFESDMKYVEEKIEPFTKKEKFLIKKLIINSPQEKKKVLIAKNDKLIEIKSFDELDSDYKAVVFDNFIGEDIDFDKQMFTPIRVSFIKIEDDYIMVSIHKLLSDNVKIYKCDGTEGFELCIKENTIL